jgi:hypothetical protein
MMRLSQKTTRWVYAWLLLLPASVLTGAQQQAERVLKDYR